MLSCCDGFLSRSDDNHFQMIYAAISDGWLCLCVRPLSFLKLTVIFETHQPACDKKSLLPLPATAGKWGKKKKSLEDSSTVLVTLCSCILTQSKTLFQSCYFSWFSNSCDCSSIHQYTLFKIPIFEAKKKVETMSLEMFPWFFSSHKLSCCEYNWKILTIYYYHYSSNFCSYYCGKE